MIESDRLNHKPHKIYLEAPANASRFGASLKMSLWRRRHDGGWQRCKPR